LISTGSKRVTTNLQIPKMVGLSWNVSAEGQARNKQRKYLRRIDEAYKPRIVCDAEFFRERKIRSVGPRVIPASAASQNKRDRTT
jgi:hypothetical protein